MSRPRQFADNMLSRALTTNIISEMVNAWARALWPELLLHAGRWLYLEFEEHLVH